jgi:NAD-specific glutamate dehydrogenase
MAEISCGEKVFVSPRYSTCTMGLPSLSMTLKGQDSMSFFTVSSSKRRPMRRLAAVSRNHIGGTDALDVEDGVGRVHGGLVLGSLANQALLGGEGHEGRGGEVALLVRNWPLSAGDFMKADAY